MAINPKLLNQGEHVVVSTRSHPKALFVPFVVLLLVVFVTSFLAGLINREVGNDTTRTVMYIVLGLVAVSAFALWVLKPFLEWFTTSFTFTDRRFIHRSGFIAKEGRTIPLNRISGVDFEMGVIDRLLGCGTLVVADASEQGRVQLDDIPHVERIQKQVAEQLQQLNGHERRDDGT